MLRRHSMTSLSVKGGGKKSRIIQKDGPLENQYSGLKYSQNYTGVCTIYIREYPIVVAISVNA